MLRRIFVPFLLLLALVARLEAAVDLVTLPISLTETDKHAGRIAADATSGNHDAVL